MAKIPFSKLGLKTNLQTHNIKVGEHDIEIQSYLPMQEKAIMIANIINASADNNGYYNPLKIKVFLTLEILYNYTNLTFTTKMKEDPLKLYDIIVSSGLFDEVIAAIPSSEYSDLNTTVYEVISNIYEYKNSAAGVIEVLANDYKNINFDLSEIQDKISNPNEMAFLKEVISVMNTPLG